MLWPFHSISSRRHRLLPKSIGESTVYSLRSQDSFYKVGVGIERKILFVNLCSVVLTLIAFFDYRLYFFARLVYRAKRKSIQSYRMKKLLHFSSSRLVNNEVFNNPFGFIFQFCNFSFMTN